MRDEVRFRLYQSSREEDRNVVCWLGYSIVTSAGVDLVHLFFFLDTHYQHCYLLLDIELDLSHTHTFLFLLKVYSQLWSDHLLSFTAMSHGERHVQHICLSHIASHPWLDSGRVD